LETLRVLRLPNGEAVLAPVVYTPPPQTRSEAATAPIESKPLRAPPSRRAKSAPAPTLPVADLPPDTLVVSPVAAVQLPSAQISLARPPEIQRSSVAEPAPSRGSDTPASVTPPVPVRRLTPTLPASLRTLIRTRVDVAISVTVGASGKVAGSVEAPNSPGAGKFIKRAAVNFARQWRFEPARVNGRAVQGHLRDPLRSRAHYHTLRDTRPAMKR
jgi:hypothetical protein